MKIRIFKKPFQEGDKVKINIKRILEKKNFQTLNPKYIEFITTNKGTIFTIEKPKIFLSPKAVKGIWVFKENRSEPRWLFQEHNLIKVE